MQATDKTWIIARHVSRVAGVLALSTIAGCELGNSVRDGFYGGVSDLISNILNIAVLGQ